MKLKKIYVMAAILFAATTFLMAQTTKKSVQDIAGTRSEKLIKDGKIISNSFSGDGKLQLIPQTQYTSAIKQNLVPKKNKDFYYTYETLYYIPQEVTVQEASELARSISSLKGIKYYSNTKKKEMVLYKQAFMIEDASSKTPVADKKTGNADGKTLYCLLDDNSFGETRYSLGFKQSDTELLICFKTQDDMGLGPVRAIKPGDLTISMLIIPCEKGTVVYLCADLDSKNMPGIKGLITDSITARMEAISRWFISMI